MDLHIEVPIRIKCDIYGVCSSTSPALPLLALPLPALPGSIMAAAAPPPPPPPPPPPDRRWGPADEDDEEEPDDDDDEAGCHLDLRWCLACGYRAYVEKGRCINVHCVGDLEGGSSSEPPREDPPCSSGLFGLFSGGLLVLVGGPAQEGLLFHR